MGILHVGRPGLDDNKERVPLNALARILAASGREVSRRGNVVSVGGGPATTRIVAKPVNLPTYDGGCISDVVSITTELPELPSEVVTDAALMSFNAGAALGALVRDRESGGFKVVSRLSVFKDDERAWKVYVPLVASAALLQADALLGFLRNVFKLNVAPLSLPMANEPGRWGEKEFESAAAYLKKLGLIACAGKTTLSAAIPLGEGAMSAALGDQMGVMVLDVASHPALGMGLFHSLQLPMAMNEQELTAWSNRLNRLEAEAVDAPPFFGAWCRSPDARLAYVGFWPNYMYQPGTAVLIACWMMFRSRFAVEAIEGGVNGPARERGPG